ncbi:MAG: glutamyl-tRNA reductase [Deltaproteobacteria bacterium]|jgi:glutamyl-tRNA reductase|nr:glutamyl-tRNA reductase [Deltaproteobacteria bacterium]
MDIVVVGVGHRSAPVALRERLAKGGLEEGLGLQKLCTFGRIAEGLVISTCNRVEMVAAGDSAPEVERELRALLVEASGVGEDELDPHLHVFLNLEAVEHLFRVASGLDSQVLGEPQILGQVKEAYRAAARYRTAGPIVSKLFHKCFKTAKRVRGETDLASGAVSMASAAAVMAADLLGGLAGRTALVVGTGEMAQLLGQHLKARGAGLVVAGRNEERARFLAAHLGARAADLADLTQNLALADLVVTAVGATEPVLTEGNFPRTEGRGTVVIDLGVPRNVEPSLGGREGLVLKNVDDLSEVVERNQASRRREAVKASRVIAEEVAKFAVWLNSLAVSPTIKDLIRQADQARLLELERTTSRREFSPEQVEALEAMSRALVRRLLHNPLVFAKGCHRHGRSDHSLNLFRRVFGLDG